MDGFNFDDMVCVIGGVTNERIGTMAWVVGITREDERIGSYYTRFQPGTVYTIEFEDGDSTDVVESDLTHWHQKPASK